MHFVQSDMLRVFAWPDGNPSEMIHYSFALVVRYLTFGYPKTFDILSPILVLSCDFSMPHVSLSFYLMLFVPFYLHSNRSLIIVHVDNVNEPYFVLNYFTFCCLLTLCDIKCCSRFNAFCVRSWICFTILVVVVVFFLFRHRFCRWHRVVFASQFMLVSPHVNFEKSFNGWPLFRFSYFVVL